MNMNDSIHADRMLDLKGAREALAEKLKDGKRVGGCDLFNIIDTELNGERYRVVVESFWSLLLMETDDCMVRAEKDKMRDGFIERYLDQHEDLVREEAAQMAAEEE